MLRLLPIVVAITLGLTLPASASQLFFSPVGTVGGGVSLGDPQLYVSPSSSTASLYVWSTDDQDVDALLSFDVTSSTPGVIAFTGSEIFAPQLFSEASQQFDGRRWGLKQDGDSTQDGTVSTNSITGLAATKPGSVEFGTGVLAANDGTIGPDLLRDPLYDTQAGAFLLARIDFSRTGSGSTTIGISASQGFIVNGGQ
ncbi:MAG: hypothetical protein MI741_03835, partial [Rhodospirillales bacterium]|nr:hypothetical protein [Rhodospirillales bacterium]